MKIIEKPSRQIEIELTRFFNINVNNSGDSIAKDLFYSIHNAIESSKLSKQEKLNFFLELESCIIKSR
jgi:hypothetical protein